VAPLADYRRRLRAHIREVAPDIVHTHGLKTHLFAAWSNPGLAAVVWHLHDYVGRRPATASLLRRSLTRCRAILANSRSVADDARAVLDGRVPIVPVLNAVDLARFSPEGPCADLDAASGSGGPAPTPAGAPGVVRVGLLGTFAKWKGHATFLDACARVPLSLGVHAYVIGGPVYHTDNSQVSLADLRAHATAAGLTGRVTFHGFVPAADTVLRALDVVVHASTDPEPFGLVIAEAMACGRAVVAADAGGARELVTPGVDALVHTPGDAASLAARIHELAADAGLRTRLGAAARATAVRRFDRARLAAEILPVYRQASAARSRA
jgi:glycosyltransferase involved in cell wall biosynthesis